MGNSGIRKWEVSKLLGLDMVLDCQSYETAFPVLDGTVGYHGLWHWEFLNVRISHPQAYRCLSTWRLGFEVLSLTIGIV